MTSAAQAQEQVLLLAPETPDPVLIELYHRLEAELRIHGFQTVTLVSTAEDSAGAALGARAKAQGAFAAIAMVVRDRNAALDVWLVDRDTGRANLRTLSASAGDETANLVAVRAVDLLRASMAARARQAREAAGAQAPPSSQPVEEAALPGQETKRTPAPAATGGQTTTPQATAPSRTSEAPEQEEEPEEEPEPSVPRPVRPTPFLSFRAEAFGSWQGPRVGVALGPALSGWITLLPRLRVGAMAVGTRTMGRIETSIGTAGMTQELFSLELELTLASLGDLKISAAGGGGVMLLQADGGDLESPRESRKAFQWTWMVSAGPRLSYWLSRHWSLTAAVSVRLYMPDVIIAVLTEETRLGRPSFDAALGVSFSP